MRCKYRRSKTLLCREIMQRRCEGTRHKRTVAAMHAGPSTGSGPRYMPLPVQGVTPFACAVEEQTKASFSVQTAAPAAQLRHGGCERAPTLPLHWVGCTGWQSNAGVLQRVCAHGMVTTVCVLHSCSTHASQVLQMMDLSLTTRLLGLR